MTTIIVAAGLCSAIRPKLLTAFPPKRYPSVKITAHGEGHWHIPCPDSMVFPDDDIWVKKHIAYVEVEGDLSFAKWAEYIVCRLIAAEGGTMRLMSPPLEQRNATWAAKWNTLPEPGEWRQKGCKHKPPKQQAQSAKQTKTPAKHTGKRKPAAPRTGGLLSGALVLRRQRRSR